VAVNRCSRIVRLFLFRAAADFPTRCRHVETEIRYRASRDGITRWLASRSSSAELPSSNRRANGGHGEERRAVQRAGERAGELPVRDRLRRGDVERPVGVPVEDVTMARTESSSVTYRHPLAATTERPTYPQPKRQQLCGAAAPPFRVRTTPKRRMLVRESSLLVRRSQPLPMLR